MRVLIAAASVLALVVLQPAGKVVAEPTGPHLALRCRLKPSSPREAGVRIRSSRLVGVSRPAGAPAAPRPAWAPLPINGRVYFNLAETNIFPAIEQQNTLLMKLLNRGNNHANPDCGLERCGAPGSSIRDDGASQPSDRIGRRHAQRYGINKAPRNAPEHEPGSMQELKTGWSGLISTGWFLSGIGDC